MPPSVTLLPLSLLPASSIIFGAWGVALLALLGRGRERRNAEVGLSQPLLRPLGLSTSGDMAGSCHCRLSFMESALPAFSHEHPRVVFVVAWCLSPRHKCSSQRQSPFIPSLPFRPSECCCPPAPMRQPVLHSPSPGGVETAAQKLSISFYGKLALGKTLSVLNQVTGSGVKTLNEMRNIRGLNLKHLNRKL